MFLFKKATSKDKRIYLTFDDGPNPDATPGILDVLDVFEIKAAFFLIGKNIKRYPEVVKDIHARGHLIGNHSHTHPMLFPFFSPELQIKQTQEVDDTLENLGIQQSRYFRPPNAICTQHTRGVFKQYNIVGVNHWICDNLIFSSRLIVSTLLKSIRFRGGGIIVLHDGAHSLISRTRKIIATALNELIPRLLSQGYQFHRLDKATSSNVIIKESA
ncbi:MAG: polysaccharide deacetylase family protein [Candidatus Omnitrophica bacterium]|nr:polysaccharide deacetylase family protein [Candidatus Omnitrophota bacterium]